jgi:hypothetical protein
MTTDTKAILEFGERIYCWFSPRLFGWTLCLGAGVMPVRLWAVEVMRNPGAGVVAYAGRLVLAVQFRNDMAP